MLRLNSKYSSKRQNLCKKKLRSAFTFVSPRNIIQL